ncbi:MAG: hypothetical protein AAGM36_04990 [Cyanobacteria bacterium J06597_1]
MTAIDCPVREPVFSIGISRVKQLSPLTAIGLARWSDVYHRLLSIL